MIEFRDQYVKKELGIELLVNINEEGLKLGIDPAENSEKHTEVMKTDSLKMALNKYGFDAAFGGLAAMKKNRELKNGSFPSATSSIDGIPRINVPSFGIFTTLASILAKAFAFFHFPIGPSSMYGNTSTSKRSHYPIFILRKFDQ